MRWVTAYEGAIAETSLNTVSTTDSKTTSSNNSDSGLVPRFSSRKADLPRLFITPNAAGIHKQALYIASQNNIKLMGFERQMRDWLTPRHWDMLGMFNLTVQSVSHDGTHATMESNLVKSMMVCVTVNSGMQCELLIMKYRYLIG